jgi:hypothetical protein
MARRFTLLLGMLTISTAGCLGTPPAPEMPSFDPAGSAAAAMEQFDANKDGKLDATELAKSPGLAGALVELDANNDKSLDLAEISARLQNYADGGVARKMFAAQVQMNGAAVTDAEVRFVPEQFMLGAVAEGSGKTDSGGLVTISIPNVDPPGINVGFYKVVVSKKDATGKETLPAKFNTETILGMEVPAFTLNRTAGTPTIILK